MDIGSAVGREAGLTDAEMAALADYATSPLFGELDRLVLDYAVEMSRAQVDVPDALYAGLHRHLDDAQMVELTASIAWENYRARFNRALAIESQGFSEGAYCVLPEPRARLES